MSDDDRKVLLDEYKMVQDKIDKIGAFKFVIRGWAMTISSAIIASSFTPNAAQSRAVFFLVPILLLFWVLEAHELNVRVLLSRRALRLEAALRKSGMAPATASWLATQLARPGRAGKLLRLIHDRFYFLLILLILLVLTERFVDMRAARPMPTATAVARKAADPAPKVLPSTPQPGAQGKALNDRQRR